MSASPIVFAHAGHWLVQLAYLVPLAALAVAYGVGKVRERRSGAQSGGDDGAESASASGALAKAESEARRGSDGG